MFVSQLEWTDRNERSWTIRGFWSIEHVLEGPLVFESGDLRYVINQDLTHGTDEEVQRTLEAALIMAWPPVRREPVQA